MSSSDIVHNLLLNCVTCCTSLISSSTMWHEFHLFCLVIVIVVVLDLPDVAPEPPPLSWPQPPLLWLLPLPDILQSTLFHCDVVVQCRCHTFCVGTSCVVHDVGTVRTPWLLFAHPSSMLFKCYLHYPDRWILSQLPHCINHSALWFPQVTGSHSEVILDELLFLIALLILCKRCNVSSFSTTLVLTSKSFSPWHFKSFWF